MSSARNCFLCSSLRRTPSDSKVADTLVGKDGGAIVESGLTPTAKGVNIRAWATHPDLGCIQDTYPGAPGPGMWMTAGPRTDAPPAYSPPSISHPINA